MLWSITSFVIEEIYWAIGLHPGFGGSLLSLLSNFLFTCLSFSSALGRVILASSICT